MTFSEDDPVWFIPHHASSPSHEDALKGRVVEPRQYRNSKGNIRGAYLVDYEGGAKPKLTPAKNLIRRSPEDEDDRTVRIMHNITRLSSSPQIVDGKLSGTGKTILVELPNGTNNTKSYRLDAEAILSGDTVYRKSRHFRLYTPERFRNAQSKNLNPGPVRGANEVSDEDDLPDATHELDD